jgi:hypothetical protein
VVNWLIFIVWLLAFAFSTWLLLRLLRDGKNSFLQRRHRQAAGRHLADGWLVSWISRSGYRYAWHFTMQQDAETCLRMAKDAGGKHLRICRAWVDANGHWFVASDGQRQ